jgi:hypothetical protein
MLFQDALFMIFITFFISMPALLVATIDILLGPPVLLTTLYLFSYGLFRLHEDDARHYLEHYE